jgi:hypothetical protein
MIATLTKADARISSDNLKKQKRLGGDSRSEPASEVQAAVTD